MENTQTNNVEGINENKINYQFIPVPLKLFYCCDMNCRSLLTSLVQLSTAFKSEKGWFFRTTDDLRHDSLLSENVLRASLDSLYKKNLLSIIYNTSEGHFFKVNFEEFEKYENIEFEDCRNDENKIDTEKYKNSHYSPSYCSDSDKRKERLKKKMAKSEHLMAKSEHLMAKSEHHLAKSEHNIDNISNIDKSLNKNKILNRENDLLENTKEEENLDNGIESILNGIFDDNSTNDKNTNIVTVPASQGKELIDTNEELKQTETNTSDLRGYSKEDKVTIGINEKEAYKDSFEYNNELNEYSNEEIYINVSASQNEETYNNNIMDTSTKEKYNKEELNYHVTVPATLGKELNNSNEDNLNSEAVGSDLRDNSNEDDKGIENSTKDALIASNYTNNELNEYSNEEIYIKVKPFKKNIEVMDNNKEDNKVLPCKTSQSATREVTCNFDSAAARPAAASAEDVKMIIDTVIKMIAKLKNFNTIGDFDYSAKLIYKITDELEQYEEVINNNDIRSTVELCINTIEVLRNDLIKEVNKKKQTKQYYY